VCSNLEPDCLHGGLLVVRRKQDLVEHSFCLLHARQASQHARRTRTHQDGHTSRAHPNRRTSRTHLNRHTSRTHPNRHTSCAHLCRPYAICATARTSGQMKSTLTQSPLRVTCLPLCPKQLSCKNVTCRLNGASVAVGPVCVGKHV
jgi:hypothetical protein